MRKNHCDESELREMFAKAEILKCYRDVCDLINKYGASGARAYLRFQLDIATPRDADEDKEIW